MLLARGLRTVPLTLTPTKMSPRQRPVHPLSATADPPAGAAQSALEAVTEIYTKYEALTVHPCTVTGLKLAHSKPSAATALASPGMSPQQKLRSLAGRDASCTTALLRLLCQTTCALYRSRCAQIFLHCWLKRRHTTLAEALVQCCSMKLQQECAHDKVVHVIMARRKSPESLIQTKAQQLANIGPAGWGRAIAYAAACIPLWLTSAVQLAIAVITRCVFQNA